MTSLALAAALLLQAEPAATAKPAAEPAAASYQVRELGPGHTTAGTSTDGSAAAPAPAKTAGTTAKSAYGVREGAAAHGAAAPATVPASSPK